MNDFYKRFKNYIEKQELVDLNSCEEIIIGVSGGADSVCLLLLFNELKREAGIRVKAVHINHNLRGEEALADQKFTEELCRELGIELKVFSEDVKKLSYEKALTLEEAGREIRYRRFKEEAEKNKAKIAVAHHANDNAETVIFNIIRGTDLHGIKGIDPKTERDGIEIIRPLLFAEKHEIEEYLSSLGRDFRVDATNLDTSYTRNKIRHNILEEMKEINPQAVKHINRLAENAREAEKLLDEKIHELEKNSVSKKEDKIIINEAALKNAENSEIKKIVYNAIVSISGRAKDITEKHVEESVKLLKGGTGKKANLPYGIEAVKENGDLVLKKAALKSESVFKKIELKNNVQRETVQNMKYVFETVQVNDLNRAGLIEKNKYTKAFDYDKITDSLFLRTRRPGDCIILQNGRKSLNRFFIDNKIPKDKRDEIHVLASGNEILWIVGFRIGENFKITKETRKALIVEVSGEDNEQY